MQNHAPGADVIVTAHLAGEGGETFLPTQVRWRVLDEADAEVRPWAVITLPTPATPVVTVTVPAALNAVPAGATRAIRRVEFEVQTATGTHLVHQTYLLQASSALVFGVNTFLTYAQAELLTFDFAPNYLQGWHQALTNDEREQALSQAFFRIIKLSLRSSFEDDQQRIIYHPWGKSKFEDLSPAQYADLESKMLRALKRAQLIEASHILTEDGVNAARRDGLMSMTTGESSQFFRPSKPLELGVCKDAYRELARWINRQVYTARG